MIEVNGTEMDEMAGQTLSRLREAMAGSEAPSVTRIIEIIRKMSDKADVLSTQDLAEAIGHDLTTMVKVMKAANCLQFNPSALEVSTLARAVSVIGFNKIQNLTLSLMLLEGAENRGLSEEVRDASARALCGALVAEELIRKRALADPEEAFIAAALRGYGRLLLSTILTEDYREAERLTAQMPADRAYGVTFGITPLEVSRRLLGEENFSNARAKFFDPISPALLRTKEPTTEEAVVLAGEFSAALAELVNRPANSSGDCERQMDELLERYSPLGLKRETMKEILENVRTRLDDFGRAQGTDSFGSRLMQRLRSLADGSVFSAVSSPARPGAVTVPEEQVAPARGSLALAVKRIRELHAAPPGAPESARGILAIAVDAIRKAMRLAGCVIFTLGPDGRRYGASVGDGKLFRQIENQLLIDPTRRDVFTVCLTTGEDVLIQDPKEARIAPFVPAWFQDALEGGPFLLLPVKDAKGVFAVVCGVMAPGQRIELGITRLSQFRTLRQLLSGLRPAPSEAGSAEQKAA